MMPSTSTMREIVEDEPLFAEFLVSKGFPFTLENPIVDLVTLDDVVTLRNLDKDELLGDYNAYRLQYQK